MLQGALIAESIQPGMSLDDLRLIVRRISWHAPRRNAAGRAQAVAHGVPGHQLDWPA